MKLARGSGQGVWRSRWAAIGAAVAVALGGGGLLVASAADGVPSSLVSVPPERVVDSRVDLGVDGPLASMQPVVVQITGSVSTAAGASVIVPEGATAVVANVTVVGPTSAGHMSVRPVGPTGEPSTSSLNFSAGQTVGNELIVQLPATGDFEVYYSGVGSSGATADLVVDVVGYYIPSGAQALQGPAGPQGETGPAGPQGETGAAGAGGAAGPAATAAAAQFYALGATAEGPTDNLFPVALGDPVLFPRDGPSVGDSIISRIDSGSFKLAAIGVYRVSYQVPVEEAGQLILSLDHGAGDVDLAYTSAGRATGTSQITATVLVKTTVVNSILKLKNSRSASALTITPLPGGSNPYAATLLIEALQ
jgi:hypothetical protein